MRRLLPVALLALVCSALPSGADPLHLPTDLSGWATPNVTPLAHVATVGAGVSGAFYDKTTFVLSVADEAWNEVGVNPVPVTGGVQVYDTSNPADPQLEGYLPLPHQQNEDISVSSARKIAIVSQDWLGVPGRLYVVDMTQPTLPTVKSVLVYPGSYGHTATLVDHDRYLWVSGGSQVLVVDLRDLAKPVVAGSFPTPAGAAGHSGVGVHDAEVDQYGDITVYGSGGTAVYELTATPTAPRLIASIAPQDNTQVRNGLIHHGGKRLDRDTWLLTEEDYAPGCGSAAGAFEVWRIDRAAKRLRFVSMWDAPKDADAGRGAVEQTQYCSSHWFTLNSNKVVADGWYGAGVRFLDISDPKHPRPIGIWAGDSTTASQALFAPGHDDIVYVPDYVRGLDVIRLAKGGRGAPTVTDAQTKRVGSSTVPGLRLRFRLTPDRRWGFTCLVVSPAHEG